MIRPSIYECLYKRLDAPFFVYDLGMISSAYDELAAILPEGATLFYSVKANPLPAIISCLAEQGASFEISSAGELRAVQDARATSRTMLGGPGKTERLIQQALAAGVDRFSAESTEDLRKITTLAEANHKRVSLFVRINPACRSRSALQMTGTSSQFGIDDSRWDESIMSYLQKDCVASVGVHVYFGTQIPHQHLDSTFAEVLHAAENFEARAKIKIDMINFGGGFASPYGKIDSQIDRLPGSLELEAATRGGRKLFFESGRFICSRAGTLFLEVLDVKHSRGVDYVILNGGINVLGGINATGRLVPINFEISHCDPSTEGRERRRYRFCGPLCTPIDVLNHSLETAEMRIGDRVFIPNVGAYGRSVSLQSFLSFDPAYECTVRGNELTSIFQYTSGYRAVK